jgi:hypothetical protein
VSGMRWNVRANYGAARAAPRSVGSQTSNGEAGRSRQDFECLWLSLGVDLPLQACDAV